MNTATISGVVIATCGLLIISMAALIKSMVLSKLDQIQDMFINMNGRVNQMDGRVIRLEEWRENTSSGANVFGRRKIDACPMPDCPHQKEA